MRRMARAGARWAAAALGRHWEWLTAGVLAVVLLRLGLGSFRRLSIVLGTGDLLPGYATNCMWAAGEPGGGTRFGFPFGMELLRFPTNDILHNVMAGAIGALTGNCILGTNAVFALSFPLTAVATVWVLRLVGLRGPLAVVLSLAVTTVPYHWMRLGHIYLATMYPAVLGVGLALLVGSGAVSRAMRRGGSWRSRTGIVLVTVIVGTGGIYYAAFTLLLCAVALVFRFCRGSSWRDLARGVAAPTFVALTVALALAPALVLAHQHPATVEIAERYPFESVSFAGVLAAVVMPAPVSALSIMAPLAAVSQKLYTAGAQIQDAGVLWSGDSGSVVTSSALLFALLGGLWVGRRRHRGGRFLGGPPTLLIATLAAVLLFYVPWGLNYLLAVYISAQIRAWDRWAPVILLLFVLLAAHTWRALRLPTRGGRAAVAAVLLFAVIVVDSVLPYRSTFDEAASSGQVLEDEGLAYAAELNGAVPGSCGVVQLPDVDFPESGPRGSLGVYDPLLPALTNAEKNWTIGAMKDTLASSWLDRLDADLTSDDLGPLEAAGFCAVHVDLRAFDDATGARLIASLTSLLGEPVATGLGGKWVAFELPRTASPVTISESDLDELTPELRAFFAPPAVIGTQTLSPEPDYDGVDRAWWVTTQNAELDVIAVDEAAPVSKALLTLRAPSCAVRTVSVQLTGGSETVTQQVNLAAGQEVQVELTLDTPVATARLAVSLDGDPCADVSGRTFAVELVNVRATAS